jgi:AcrR family transcriptional regulator
MQKHDLNPRKKPRQARAEATVEAILEAATRIFSEGHFDGFNTNRVAEIAGVSIGSLYQYFPSKEALTAALIERAQKSLADAIEASIDESPGKPFDTVLAELVDVAIDHQFARAEYAAALDHAEQRLPVEALIMTSQRRIVSTLQKFLECAWEGTLPPMAAADSLAIAKALIEAEAGRPEPNIGALRQRVVRALLGYLRME